MCGPGALGPLLIASSVITMAGQGMSALQQASQAKYQARIATRNAGLENEAAQREIDNTRTAALEHYRKVGALKGQQRVTAAANGVSLDFGSASDVASNTEMLAREDVDRIYKQGFEKTRGFEINASNYRAEALSAKAAKKNALVNGAFNMASTALGGAQQYSKMKSARAGV